MYCSSVRAHSNCFTRAAHRSRSRVDKTSAVSFNCAFIERATRLLYSILHGSKLTFLRTGVGRRRPNARCRRLLSVPTVLCSAVLNTHTVNRLVAIHSASCEVGRWWWSSCFIVRRAWRNQQLSSGSCRRSRCETDADNAGMLCCDLDAATLWCAATRQDRSASASAIARTVRPNRRGQAPAV